MRAVDHTWISPSGARFRSLVKAREHAESKAGKAELAAAIRVAEPERWEGANDAEIAEKLDLDAAIDALASHAAALVEVQRALYVDAIADDAPATVADEKASFMRVRPHMALLEHAMESHLAW